MDEQNIFKDRIANIPAEIKKFLASESWTKTVRDITVESGLPSDKGAVLENEVVLVLTGMDLERNLAENLQGQLEVSMETAETIAQKIRERIIAPFENLLPQEEESTLPAAIPDILPETLPNEPVRVVPHVETPPNNPTKPNLSFPSSNYPKGQDPYHEPLE